MMPLDPDFVRVPIAHRGFHDAARGRPENSRAAVLAAVAAGYGVEIDVQISADGVPVVFHDYTLARMTGGKGPVRGHTAAVLAATPLRGSDQRIPLLRDILDLVAGRVPLLIEIKDQDGAMGPDVGPLEQATALALDGYLGPVAVMSFNPFSMRAFAGLAPQVARGLVTSAYRPRDWPLLPAATCDRLREIPDYDAVGACFISHEAGDLDRARVAALKAQGATINCWTIRSPEAEVAARRIADTVTFEGYAPVMADAAS